MHRFKRDTADTCECGQPPCVAQHEDNFRLPHVLFGYSASLFDTRYLVVRCKCGAEARYDTQWGTVIAGATGNWRSVETALQEAS
jgi:hypothetical protein